jgi:hypothetical protein
LVQQISKQLKFASAFFDGGHVGNEVKRRMRTHANCRCKPDAIIDRNRVR